MCWQRSRIFFIDMSRVFRTTKGIFIRNLKINDVKLTCRTPTVFFCSDRKHPDSLRLSPTNNSQTMTIYIYFHRTFLTSIENFGKEIALKIQKFMVSPSTDVLEISMGSPEICDRVNMLRTSV